MANSNNKETIIIEAFQKDICNLWKQFFHDHPEETPYALVMYGNEEVDPELFPVFLTNKSLEKVSNHYVKKGLMETVDEAKKALRFSVEDAENLFEYADSMTNLKEAMKSVGVLRGSSGWKKLTKAAMEALALLDKEGLFGEKKDHENLLLLVIVIESDNDYFTNSLKKLNPSNVSKKILNDIEKKGVYKSCSKLVLSPDGQNLYAVCSVPNPNPNDSRNSQDKIVLYTINGTKLTPQWKYVFYSFGAAISDMVVTPKGKLIIVRSIYSGFGSSSKVAALFQLFNPKSNKSVKENKINVNPIALAIDKKGSRIALLTDKEVLILNDSLKLLKKIDLNQRGYRIIFLNKKELLLTTRSGILKVSFNGKVEPTSITEDSFFITSNIEKSLMAVGNLHDYEGKREKRIEYKIRLYNIKNLELLKDFHLPDHQLSYPVLSPNGKYLFCLSNRLHGDRKSFVVFDVETGRLLNQSDKIFFHSRPYFLPDNQSVVFPDSGIMENEPIRFMDINTMK